MRLKYGGMNSAGIDVSKGKSMIAVMRPFGEVVVLRRKENTALVRLNKSGRAVSILRYLQHC